VHGMYSFVPALPAATHDPRFARPPIRLPRLIKPTNRQSTWGSKRPLSASEVRNARNEVRRQVLDAGLVLAVNLETPPKRKRCAHNASRKSNPLLIGESVD